MSRFKLDETTITGRDPILRTNRFFVKLTDYGTCDDRGCVVMGVGLSNKTQIVQPDRPLMTLLLPLLEMLTEGFTYSTHEAAVIDCEKFKAAVADWEVAKT